MSVLARVPARVYRSFTSGSHTAPTTPDERQGGPTILKGRAPQLLGREGTDLGRDKRHTGIHVTGPQTASASFRQQQVAGSGLPVAGSEYT